MKWAAGILLTLGLFAAGATAVLFGWVQAQNMRLSPQAAVVDVVIAQADLPARTRLMAEQTTVDSVPRAGLPAGCYSNPAQAIGKTLKVAVVKGQPLTASCFLPEKAIDDLLPPGMLAFQIPLARRSTAVDLLYPGCIVDVFATFPLQDRHRGEAVTTPLLQNIQVLSVQDETVVSASQEKGKEGSLLSRKSSGHGGDVAVGLQVTARQAAALQLALERGTLGLAMRNPLDKNLNPTDPLVMKEGQLTASSEALDPQTLALVNQLQTLLGNRPAGEVNSPPAAPVPAAPEKPAGPVAPPDSMRIVAKRSTWPVTIIRGQKVEEAQLKLTDEREQETPPAEESTAGE